MNILIVEDDMAIANFMKRILSQILVTQRIQISSNFKEGFNHALSNSFDVILIDIILGKKELSGIELCKAIRKGNKKIPIIMVTSLNNIEKLEMAFDAGANDYIGKPFRPRELQLRVKRWVSFSEQIQFSEKMSYKNLVYHPLKNEFYYDNKKLQLSKKNKSLLSLFLRNPEKIISQKYIREKLWGDYDHTEKNRNVRSNIHLLRKALASKCPIDIETIRGEGYVLTEGK